MKSDIYTKIMLAVIALNLTVLTGINLTQRTNEKVDKGPTEVVITGAKINSGSGSVLESKGSGDVLVDIRTNLRSINSSLNNDNNQEGPIEVDIKKVGGYNLGSYNWNMPSIPVEVRN